MPASAYDSFYFRDRYGSPAMRAIWDDRAMVQRWLDVEAALALQIQLNERIAVCNVQRVAAGEPPLKLIDIWDSGPFSP